MSGSQPNPMSRRGFLGLAGAALAVPALAACNVSGSSNQSGSSGGAAGELKFWDMPWGTPAYSELGKKIVESYTPPQGFGKATYQTIQWNGFYQTFSSAIASKTGPAVSSGAGFQAFQFAEQGAIAYADKLVESLKSDSAMEFLPGLVDTLKTPDGYVAVPWQTDVRPLWYNKALLEQAGTKVPTTWDELLTAGQALKKIGVSGFATGAGSGNNLGAHTMVAMMINNGGGLFTPDGRPDCVTDANIQAMQFVQQLANEGIIDKGAVSYTTDNLVSQWNSKKAGLGIYTPGLAANASSVADDLVVAAPLKSPSGTAAGLFFVNNLMMYTNTPSQDASEAFLKYYLGQIHQYWESPVGVAVPALKSIADSAAYTKDPNQVKIVKEWIPVCKTYAALKKESFAALASVDGGQALSQFTQTMLQGKTDPKAALTTLQQGLEQVVKS